MPDILADFLSAVRRHGLLPPDKILPDGKIHRFRSGPEKSENGYYFLRIFTGNRGNDFGYGLIGCWKRDLKENWRSWKDGQITKEDRQLLKKAQDDLKKAENAAAEESARKAVAIWKGAGAADGGHVYLKAKGIIPKGLREHKGVLVVPIYVGGKLASLQFIGTDGKKRFLSGGKVEGGYASITEGPSRDRIVIAEGYATAASLFQATGLPAVVAFNAGNLLAVARAIRGKYPEAELVIAGDNDQWTIIRGEAVNVGVEKATAAARAVDGKIAIPGFGFDDPEKPSDWNDFWLRHGAEATKIAFETAIKLADGDGPNKGDDNSPSEPPPEPPDLPEPLPMEAAGGMNDWRARLIPGKMVAEGHPFPFERKSKTNAYLFLKHHQRFAGMLCYNEFTDSVMLSRRPPWEEGDFDPRSIRDDDFFMLSANLEYCDISVAKDTAADAAIRVAKENSINPPREYLSRLQWDNQSRLATWLTYYLGADEQPAEYLSLVGVKWLTAAVGRVFQPGCKFDSVLILEGSQGIGKSMALRALSTFNGQDFFLDSVGDIRSKDTLMSMQGKLIVEIAELASFKKSENEEIKAFISRQVDEYRPPYGRTVIKRPRFFVLAASTNEIEEGYLTDDTGNRRYWPVKCKAIDYEALERDAPQLWAEAVVRFKNGERTWLAAEESPLSVKEQKQRFMEDAWQERIGQILRHESVTRVDDILNKLELKPKDINNLVKKRVKNSLRQLGWFETRRSGEGRVWRPAGVDPNVVAIDGMRQADLLEDVLLGESV